MLKFFVIGVPVVIVLFLIIVALQPADFRVARSAVIAAPVSTVFERYNDLHQWNDWSPWAKLDPNAKNSFSGPSAGVGAGMTWVGNNKVGEGSMTIIESKPGELVRMKLEFIKPFAGTSITEFTLQPDGDRTAVTWTMSGTNGFMGKAMGLIMNCDKMVGGQFEQGFANLKALVEPPAKS